jgi:hypothetical protein
VLDALRVLRPKHVRFQHAYAEGIIGLDDLKARLAELDDARTILLSERS